VAQDEQGVVSKAVVCVEWEVVAGMETEAVVCVEPEVVAGMESEAVVCVEPELVAAMEREAVVSSEQGMASEKVVCAGRGGEASDELGRVGETVVFLVSKAGTVS
jgi:hypothetical protein